MEPAAPGAGVDAHGIAPKSIQDRYLQTTLEAVRTFDWTISNLTGVTDRRPKYLARQIINRTLDDETRHKLLQEFDKKLDEIYASDANNDEKADAVIQVSIDAVGETISYLDEYLNIHRKNEIGDA